MAITTIAGVLAGLQTPQYFSKVVANSYRLGSFTTTWASAGTFGTGTYNSTPAGLTLSSSGGLVTGQIPHYDPSSGNSYVARVEAQANAAGQLMICDRLWSNGGLDVTLTNAQTVNSVTWPARDASGGTNGIGVLIGLEVSATVGAANPTITLTYTNTTGTTNQTSVIADTGTMSSINTGAFLRFGLAAGDRGVQTVTSVQLSTSWLSGTMNLVAYRVLATVELSAVGVPNAVDAVTGGFTQVINGTVPFILFAGLSSSVLLNVSGQYVEAQG